MTVRLLVPIRLTSEGLVLEYTLRVRRHWFDNDVWMAMLDDRDGVLIHYAEFPLKVTGDEPWHLLAAALTALRLLEDGITIPGWRCAACHTFHATGPGHGAVTEGRAKVPRSTCRSCGAARPVG